MNYQDYIRTELLSLVPVLYVIGMGLKKSRLPDKWIPVALGVLAVLLSALFVAATVKISNLQEAAAAMFTSVTQGVLIAGASVYVNQLYIQVKKKE